MANNITVNMENLSDKERETLLSLIEKANTPVTSPFDKVADGETYFFINGYGDTEMGVEEEDYGSECLRAVGNYCTDEDLLGLRAERETLNRLLWEFSIENERQDPRLRRDWAIEYDGFGWSAYRHYDTVFGAVKFSTQELAKRAILEVIFPFVNKHPKLGEQLKGGIYDNFGCI